MVHLSPKGLEDLKERILSRFVTKHEGRELAHAYLPFLEVEAAIVEELQPLLEEVAE